MSIDYDLAALIPVRRGSSRIENKCMLPFGDSTDLISWKIRQLLLVLPASNIYVSSEDDSFLNIARELGVRTLPRDPSIAIGHDRPFTEVITGIVNDVPHEHIAWCTVVCPLLSPREYREAFSIYKDKVIFGNNDSLLSVNAVKEYFWSEDGPLNYQADRNHTISQDLPNWYRVTNGIYMMCKSDIMNLGYFVGKLPFKFPVSKISGIDIDYIEDYRIAKSLYDFYIENELEFLGTTS
jgi:CMP-N-acetylneuraminic acid synthetase